MFRGSAGDAQVLTSPRRGGRTQVHHRGGTL